MSPPPRSGTKCRSPGCSRSQNYPMRELCEMHYAEWRRNDPSAPRCRTDGCGKAGIGGGGLCGTHRRAEQRASQSGVLERDRATGLRVKAAWRARTGGPVGTLQFLMRTGWRWRKQATTKDGYRCVKLPHCRVLVHRLVMSEHIARALRRSETVHHINGDRSDNRIENLQLRHGNHGPGIALQCRTCGGTDLVPVALAPKSAKLTIRRWPTSDNRPRLSASSETI